MRLDNASLHAQNCNIEAMAVGDVNSWSDWGAGRLSTVDRFLSNFHRPLQRRMFFSDPSVPLPASGVIKNKTTGEIYLLGQSRCDTEQGETYTRLTVAHLVSNLTGGVTSQSRLVVDEARPPETIGELVKQDLGQMYATVEFKSSSEQFNSDDAFINKFTVFGSSVSDFQQGDELVLADGYFYQVQATYTDSDFKCCYVERKADDRVTGTYHLPSTGFSYNIATGQMTRMYTDYLVTCSMTSRKENAANAGMTYDYEVFLKSPSFPFSPKVGDYMTVDGDTMMIGRIERWHEAGAQWRLICSEAHK